MSAFTLPELQTIIDHEAYTLREKRLAKELMKLQRVMRYLALPGRINRRDIAMRAICSENTSKAADTDAKTQPRGLTP